MDTTTSGGKLIFHVFGALSEFERELIRERTQAGLRADAIALRSSLHVEGPVSDVEALLVSTLGSCEVKPFNPPRAITAISAPASTGSPVFGLPPSRRPDSRRFALCRSLGDFIASPQPALVTQSNTERQQRGRAFAAEFLAPAELIRERIDGQRVCADDIDDIAAHFQVSADVIRLQIRNHGLAVIDSF